METFLIIIILVLIAFLTAAIACKQPKIVFYKGCVEITGWFGMVIPYKEVVSVVMTDDKLPSMFRSFGLCFFGFNKGDFDIYDNSEEYEVGEGCKLYTQTNKPPFIVITLKNGLKIFINFRNKELMKKYY